MRGAITENMSLLKYQKQLTSVVLNREDANMLLPTALRKSWILQMFPFIVCRITSPIENKIPDWEFYWSTNHEFSS